MNFKWATSPPPPPRALAAEKPAQAPTQKDEDEDGAMEKKGRKNYRWIDERKSSSSDVYKKWRHDHPVRHLFQHLVGVFLFFFIFPLVVDCFLFDFLKSFLLLFKRCFFFISSLLSFLFLNLPRLIVQSSPVRPARRPDQIKCCWPTQEYRKKNLPSGDDQICPETGARSTQLLHACQDLLKNIRVALSLSLFLSLN